MSLTAGPVAGPSGSQDPVRPSEAMAPLGDEGVAGGHEQEDEGMTEGGEEPGGKDGESEEDEGRVPVLRRSPATPSKQEVEEHMAAHLPFRDGRAHCVRGCGRNDPHRGGADDRRGDPVPTVAMDYGFLTSKRQDADEDDEGGAAGGECGPMLVLKGTKEGPCLQRWCLPKGRRGHGSQGGVRSGSSRWATARSCSRRAGSDPS